MYTQHNISHGFQYIWNISNINLIRFATTQIHNRNTSMQPSLTTGQSYSSTNIRIRSIANTHGGTIIGNTSQSSSYFTFCIDIIYTTTTITAITITTITAAAAAAAVVVVGGCCCCCLLCVGIAVVVGVVVAVGVVVVVGVAAAAAAVVLVVAMLVVVLVIWK